MVHQTLTPTRQRVRFCAHYSMDVSMIAVIALIVALFATAMFTVPGYKEIVGPVFYLFVAWLCGVSCAYNLPIWKHRGSTC